MRARESAAEHVQSVGALVGECPLWDDESSSLVFVDILGCRVHRYHPGTGESSHFSTQVPVGSVGLCPDGSFVLALSNHFARCGPNGEDLTRLGTFEVDAGTVRFNDGEVDPWGRFVAGTMAWDQGGARPLGSLYRLSSDGDVEVLLEGVRLSNGIAYSADRRSLYYVDTPTRVVDAFDVDPDSGALANRRVAYKIDEGAPDGIVLDVDGCLWVACYGAGRVCRFAPDGRIDRVVVLPTKRVTSLAFGGARLDTLYVTTASEGLSDEERAGDPMAGDLFAADAGVTGSLANRFA